jgi:hypothetical protein
MEKEFPLKLPLVFFFFLMALNPLQASTSFEKAAQYIQQKNYQEAEKILLPLLDKEEWEQGPIHYNLGVMNYRQSQWAKALWHFRQAQYLLPRSEEVQHNIQLTLKKTHDDIDQRFIYTWKSLIRRGIPFNFSELLVLSLFLHGLFWIFFVTEKYFTQWKLRRWRMTFSFFTFFSLGLIGVRTLWPYHYGIVSGPLANVYSGPGTDNIVLFKLHQGTEVTVLENDQAFSLTSIQLADGKRGWIQRTSMLSTTIL